MACPKPLNRISASLNADDIMAYDDEIGIIANPDILSEDYLPPNIPGREAARWLGSTKTS